MNRWKSLDRFPSIQNIMDNPVFAVGFELFMKSIEHLFCINLVIFLTDVKVMKNNTKPNLADCRELGTPPGMLQAISGRQAEGPGMPQKLPQR